MRLTLSARGRKLPLRVLRGRGLAWARRSPVTSGKEEDDQRHTKEPREDSRRFHGVTPAATFAPVSMRKNRSRREADSLAHSIAGSWNLPSSHRVAPSLETGRIGSEVLIPLLRGLCSSDAAAG
jgi:hypothetical protein